jgi:hypothetical protein
MGLLCENRSLTKSKEAESRFGKPCLLFKIMAIEYDSKSYETNLDVK